MPIQSYRDLKVWQKAVSLTVDVYRAMEHMPDDERFGLTGQIKRASVSIASNIAEGHGRQYEKEFCRFLSISYGSLMELETCIHLCMMLGYIDETEYNGLEAQTAELGKMLNGLLA
ncbi:MAG: four helix bundle protein, partial [Armatimonadota bacterium]